MVWNLCSVDSNCPRMSVSPSGAWGVRLSVLLKSVPGVSTAAACENDSLKAWLRSSCTYCQYQQLDKGLVPNTTKWPKLNHLSMKGWDFSPFLFYVAIQGLGYRAVYFSLDLKTLDKCFRLGQYRQTACEIHGSQPRFLNLWQQRERLYLLPLISLLPRVGKETDLFSHLIYHPQINNIYDLWNNRWGDTRKPS